MISSSSSSSYLTQPTRPLTRTLLFSKQMEWNRFSPLPSTPTTKEIPPTPYSPNKLFRRQVVSGVYRTTSPTSTLFSSLFSNMLNRAKANSASCLSCKGSRWRKQKNIIMADYNILSGMQNNSYYMDNRPSFRGEPVVEQFGGSHMVMTNVIQETKTKYISFYTKFSD